jgi:hypothetical protein
MSMFDSAFGGSDTTSSGATGGTASTGDFIVNKPPTVPETLAKSVSPLIIVGGFVLAAFIVAKVIRGK